MPLITFVSHDGEAKEVHVESGTNLMQAAVDNGVDGILGECGGVCSCATCHCYIDDAWVAKVPAAEDLEKDMLDCVLEPKDSSRLSCQVEVSDELDGIVVHLPESQF
ncbi:MAG: 2Fe-2S iron-sulfur cluster-binding protein [Spongiibacter sp.]|uniref:2Fe-2S iron-sulfur cluster binding domain-containing protein n=1 Tax=Spongiibacter thalassae TaxID=2721624 RepID=A0ABX1GIL5_9GAMM|nr:2Fe-2S iron-sulfur cluster-binding protein [Spongiibacter thalassae]NKI19045.1 2Fe-2S iron-sulfur cluster binding domain-containing protein [Spongiibacter thalassae]